jgi:hypothetical protein
MAEVERLRGALARIEALVWYEPEDEDDLVEAVRVMACERNEAIKQSRHALRERDAAHAEAERLRRDLARCREAQRATAEGWRHEVAEIAAIVGAPAHTAELAAYVRAEVERLRGERDEAMADFANACDVGRRQEARAEKAERERDEARRDFVRVADALGLVSTDDTGRIGQVASVDEVVAAARRIESLRAEVEMLRGAGCREAKAGEPESGPCGVCLRCAEERGAEWAIRAKAQVVYTLVGDEAYQMLAREVCRNARKEGGR